MYYLNNFLLFSIFGYFFETIMFEILNMHNQSGFMYLWWTPFYGTGVIILILIFNYLKQHIKNKKLLNILLFITIFLSLTILEYLGGAILELLHGYSLWTYKNVPLNIGKYISIPTSLAWTIFGFIYIYLIKIISDKIIKHIPKFITIMIFTIFILDLLLTIIKLIKIQIM